ncbi:MULTISPECIES: hypothetical protein [unclassified Microcoleus]|uniref:hypothetical protein n=1 Tax=unclassified Microcoleus TaxID=2642155 RepID=UPI002FD3A325
MYTLESLQQKNLKELKEIGCQLDVLPEGDRRCRQNWIDALVGVQPPLLQLLEASPAEVVEPVQEAIEVQATEPIEIQALASFQIGDLVKSVSQRWGIENKSLTGTVILVHQSGGVRVDFGSGGTFDYSRPGLKDLELIKKPIEVQAQEPIKEELFDLEELFERDSTDCPACGSVDSLYAVRSQEYANGFWDIHCDQCYSGCSTDRLPLCLGECEIEVQAQEPPIESKFGRIVYSRSVESAIAQTEKTTTGETDGNTPKTDGSTTATLVRLCAPSHHPGADTAELHGSSGGIESSNPQHKEGNRVLEVAGDSERDKGRALRSQPIELAAIYNDEQPPNRGDGKGRVESAIAPAAKKSLDAEADCSQSLPGITFSPRFLATYPPYFGEVHYKAEATGQLNLLEPETDGEPPDPDDFELLEDFKRAIALWDAKHEVNPIDNEPLDIALDSFCLWAPCPDDWYEPAAKSSSTCEFLIPVFDAWCDRQNDSDEPPDTGIGARLPGPKPPKFPPGAIGQSRDSDIPNAGQAHTKRIPITYQLHTNHSLSGRQTNIYCITYCMAAAGSSQLGRSPPGGDVM